MYVCTYTEDFLKRKCSNKCPISAPIWCLCKATKPKTYGAYV